MVRRILNKMIGEHSFLTRLLNTNYGHCQVMRKINVWHNIARLHMKIVDCVVNDVGVATNIEINIACASVSK
jgi:hypothetical protein